MTGVSKIDMAIISSDSLKDKRRVIKSLKERIRQRFNASVSETALHDNKRKGQFEIAVTATNKTGAEKVLQEILKFVEIDGRLEILSRSNHYFYCD